MNEPLDPEYIRNLWERATKSLEIAESQKDQPDWAANRAYYASFYAVSALFAVEGQYFKKHSGVRAAFHQHLIKTGRLAIELGREYDQLLALRGKADYGVIEHATPEEAEAAIKATKQILLTVHNVYPDIFPLDEQSE
jgi:uncharacterized protein